MCVQRYRCSAELYGTWFAFLVCYSSDCKIKEKQGSYTLMMMMIMMMMMVVMMMMMMMMMIRLRYRCEFLGRVGA